MFFQALSLIVSFQSQNRLKNIFPKNSGCRELDSLQNGIFRFMVDGFLQIVQIVPLYMGSLAKRKICELPFTGQQHGREFGYFSFRERTHVERNDLNDLKKNVYHESKYTILKRI